ncbi:MAG TPA: TlpA disulfide reductase family protein [Flavitalea sp.]|nr:TlpA disulfide reductase family protein [Flavitalea sp.]
MLNLRWKIILSLVVCLIALFSFLISWPSQFVITGILYLLSSYVFVVYSKTNYEDWKDYFLLTIPFILLYGIGAVVNQNPITYPIILVALINSFIGLVIARNLEKTTAAHFGLFCGIFLCILGHPGMKNYISYLRNPNPRVWQVPPAIALKNEHGEPVSLSAMKGKTIVLDFWSTTCAPCAKKFPDFDRIRQEYNKDTNIVFASVYLPRPEDKTDRVMRFGNHQDFGFQKLYAQEQASWKQFEIPFLPYLVVIDKEHNIRYRGSFHTEWTYLITNARSVIAKINED